MKSGIRIIGGDLRGRVLATPAGIRPSAGRVRESLMDIWSPRLGGASFLDLFAGSGAVGVEAVSRGATRLVLVEAEAHVAQQLNDTCRVLDLRNVKVELARLPEAFAKGLPSLNREFDLIFADPPYAFGDYVELLEVAVSRLAPTGEIAVEHESRRELPGACRGARRVDARRYGDSSLSFYQRETEARTGGRRLALPDEP